MSASSNVKPPPTEPLVVELAATAARTKAAATATPATEKLLTLKAIAEAADVSRWTVWRWHTEAGLRVVKISGICRVRERDWLEFLEQHAK